MDHNVAFNAANDVPLLPGKVVMVLDVEQDVEAQMSAGLALVFYFVCFNFKTVQQKAANIWSLLPLAGAGRIACSRLRHCSSF